MTLPRILREAQERAERKTQAGTRYSAKARAKLRQDAEAAWVNRPAFVLPPVPLVRVAAADLSMEDLADLLGIPYLGEVW